VGGLVLALSLSIAYRNVSAGSGQSSGKPAGNVENGKKLYAANRCWECHDDQGQGGNGPRIGPTALSLATVTAYLRHPRGQMPPYIPKVVSDAEIADIYAFLQSQPKPPAAKSIPLLNSLE